MGLRNQYELLKFYTKAGFKTAVAGALVQPTGPQMKAEEYRYR
jgi:hypothetical protein